MWNPYLDRFSRFRNLGWTNYLIRSRYTSMYAWAIPDEEAIQACVELSPLIEIGAGKGYWACAIAKAGGDIIAFDKNLAHKNGYYTRGPCFFPVQMETERVVAEYPKRTLLLCWPPYDNPMASSALARYKGQHVIYIGEGKWGCNANARFFNRLAKDWEIERAISLSQWWGINDRMQIYRRREVAYA